MSELISVAVVKAKQQHSEQLVQKCSEYNEVCLLLVPECGPGLVEGVGPRWQVDNRLAACQYHHCFEGMQQGQQKQQILQQLFSSLHLHKRLSSICSELAVNFALALGGKILETNIICCAKIVGCMSFDGAVPAFSLLCYLLCSMDLPCNIVSMLN